MESEISGFVEFINIHSKFFWQYVLVHSGKYMPLR